VIAALYVERDGAYYGVDDVDPWDEDRDARTYAGPWPVIAHPPCARWCQLASVNLARYGTPIGADGGTFAAALAAVRRWGGVLEHPAYSIAWDRYGLPVPSRGYWTGSLTDPGLTTEVSQVAYGHAARKRTWLYVVGVVDPPALDWSEPRHRAVVGAGVRSGESTDHPRAERDLATPPAFRDLLIALAYSVMTE
jgi:hypothetical protein